jgi:outer membrane biosynthesis protein TonB
MKPGLTISCIGHGAALGFAVLAISAQPMESPAVESLPVSFISDKDFTQLTQGVKNAPKIKFEDPKPLADEVAAPKPADQLADKVANKPEITTDSSAAKPQSKSDAKQADKSQKAKAPDYKPDQIADLLKKDDAKKPPKPDNQAQDQPARNAPAFNADQVAALLDHRDPQRQVATADQINSTANLGVATGAQDAQLSQSEIDALRSRISQCWNPPAGVDSTTKVYIVLRTLFKPDGSLAGPPVLVEGSASALGPALAESAKRALLLCQPFTMLKPEHYDQWKDLELKFDPQQLLGG